MDKFQLSPSENILQLRKLTELICDVEPETECLVKKIRLIIEKLDEDVMSSKTEKTKLKKYEKMFYEIKKIIK